MRAYILKRILLAFPTFFLATFLVFGVIRILPGDIIYTILEETLVNVPLSDVEAIKREYGYDRPLMEQYFVWMWQAAQGDLGTSLKSRKPITEVIASRLPVTVQLGMMALVLSIALAVPIGVISAIRQDTPLDYLLRGFAIGGLSIPGFWLATLAVVLPAIWFRYTPPLAYSPIFVNPIENLKQTIMPAAILGLLLSATAMRMTRTMMLEVMRQDYIRTAWAKGLRERAVIYRHALKNALIPVVTLVGLQIAAVLGGTVIMESVFSLPGMGRLLLEAITYRDYPVIQGINLLVATWVILVNLVVDVSYGFLDPRIRYT
ncbi:MAG: ABC transporter permease [Chloroflexi bacterium]|nr:ABC transporter permease [Chloroflexota bacterium]